MASTHRRTLSDLLPAAALGSVRSINALEEQNASRSTAAVAATTTLSLLRAEGNVQLRRVVFIPDTALAGDAANNWTLQLANKKTDGSTGAVNVGSAFTTTASPNNSLVAFNAVILFEGATTLADDNVLALICTKNAVAADLPAGVVQITFVPYLD